MWSDYDWDGKRHTHNVLKDAHLIFKNNNSLHFFLIFGKPGTSHHVSEVFTDYELSEPSSRLITSIMCFFSFVFIILHLKCWLKHMAITERVINYMNNNQFLAESNYSSPSSTWGLNALWLKVPSLQLDKVKITNGCTLVIRLKHRKQTGFAVAPCLSLHSVIDVKHPKRPWTSYACGTFAFHSLIILPIW